MDNWKDIALLAVTGLAAVSFGLSSWALVVIVTLKATVEVLKAQREADSKENNRRFYEVAKSLDEIKQMLADALEMRRRGDHPH